MEYKTNWWKSLKKGDIVRCVQIQNKLSHGCTREVGKEYEIFKDATDAGFAFNLSCTATKNHDDFIPIRMTNFKTLSLVEEDYSIY